MHIKKLTICVMTATLLLPTLIGINALTPGEPATNDFGPSIAAYNNEGPESAPGYVDPVGLAYPADPSNPLALVQRTGPMGPNLPIRAGMPSDVSFTEYLPQVMGSVHAGGIVLGAITDPSDLAGRTGPINISGTTGGSTGNPMYGSSGNPNGVPNGGLTDGWVRSLASPADNVNSANGYVRPMVPLKPQTKREFRGAWIATVSNIDWPSAKGMDSFFQRAEFTKMMNELYRMGMNAVIVQVRPVADAFYDSKLNPWTEYLSGKQGVPPDPYYDPLEFMIREARKRNMEFHAWVNPFRACLRATTDGLDPMHVAVLHPEWTVTYDGRMYLNPGIPEARQYVIDCIVEIVANYDVDAIHLDDYFYPYQATNQTFRDSEAYAKYGGGFASIDDWRRDNVDRFVCDLSKAIKAEKPHVKFGISPYGVWRNVSEDPTGSESTASQTAYDSLYADTRTWIREGWIDYVAPQIYWEFGRPAAPYEKMVDFWVNESRLNDNVHLYIGLAVYRIGSPNENAAWMDPNEVPYQMRYNAAFPEIKGNVFYSANQLIRNRLGFADRLKYDLHTSMALVPEMVWLNTGRLTEVESVTPRRLTQHNVSLTIKDSGNETAEYYVVYRGTALNGLDTEKPYSVVGVVRRNKSGPDTIYLDIGLLRGQTYIYAVTPMDRLFREGPISAKAQIELT